MCALTLRLQRVPPAVHLQQLPVQKCYRYRYLLSVEIVLLSLDTRKLLIMHVKINRGLSVNVVDIELSFL